MLLTIDPAPTADAGSDEETCSNTAFDLSSSVTPPSATNAIGLTWTSSGDGAFNDATIIQPIYTPGPTDSGSYYAYANSKWKPWLRWCY